MPARQSHSRSVELCNVLVRAFSYVVPKSRRADWSKEWLAEIWHRWQFLDFAGQWNAQEKLRLFRNTLGALPDGLWHLSAEKKLDEKVDAALRSPWLCLGAWAVLLLVLGCCSEGWAATRALFAKPPGSRIVFIWRHPSAGGGQRGFPSDVQPAWSKHSRSAQGVAAFTLRHESLKRENGTSLSALLVSTTPALFRTLKLAPLVGEIPDQNGIVLTYDSWKLLFGKERLTPHSMLRTSQGKFLVTGVLPRSFHFPAREPSAYLVRSSLYDREQMIIASIKPGVSVQKLDRELSKIAAEDCYYFFQGEMRYSELDPARWLPLQMFGIAVGLSALLIVAVSRTPWRKLRTGLRLRNTHEFWLRMGFFISKTGFALTTVFVAGLEWSRSKNAILLGPYDPASGPFLIWLYILGSMGVLFWSVADQKARCRVCLRLLCFPVRMGSPGSLFLDWSGMELLCSAGHGVLHVPDLAPSWDEENDRWIAMDDSWSDLFADSAAKR